MIFKYQMAGYISNYFIRTQPSMALAPQKATAASPSDTALIGDLCMNMDTLPLSRREVKPITGKTHPFRKATGFITRETARATYGVVIKDVALEVDRDATDKIRKPDSGPR